MSNPHLHVLTERLDLRKTDPVTDLDDLFPIFSDPAGGGLTPTAGTPTVPAPRTGSRAPRRALTRTD